MMPQVFIKKLKQQGITLSLVDGHLRVEGPAVALTDELKAELARYKPEIISYLSREGSGPWSELLSKVSGELYGLLSFAYHAGARLQFGGSDWRIEAVEALADEYSAWRRAMLEYRSEVEKALKSLPTPGMRCDVCGKPLDVSGWEDIAEAAWCGECFKVKERGEVRSNAG